MVIGVLQTVFTLVTLQNRRLYNHHHQCIKHLKHVLLSLAVGKPCIAFLNDFIWVFVYPTSDGGKIEIWDLDIKQSLGLYGTL